MQGQVGQGSLGPFSAPQDGLDSPPPHCRSRRGSEGLLGGWTPGLGKAQGDTRLQAPPQALVMRAAGRGPAHSPSGRAGAARPPAGTAPEGAHVSQRPASLPSLSQPGGHTLPAVCRTAGVLQLQAGGPWPWAPAQAHVATHGAGGLPAQRLAARLVVDSVPQRLCVCGTLPPDSSQLGPTAAAGGPQALAPAQVAVGPGPGTQGLLWISGPRPQTGAVCAGRLSPPPAPALCPLASAFPAGSGPAPLCWAPLPHPSPTLLSSLPTPFLWHRRALAVFEGAGLDPHRVGGRRPGLRERLGSAEGPPIFLSTPGCQGHTLTDLKAQAWQLLAVGQGDSPGDPVCCHLQRSEGLRPRPGWQARSGADRQTDRQTGQGGPGLSQDRWGSGREVGLGTGLTRTGAPASSQVNRLRQSRT